jgi:GPW/gp25 family protein
LITIQGEAPEDVIERLYVLLSTPKGTVCYDRAFGIDMGILDLPLPIARVKYMADCIEQINKYEPTVKLKDVLAEYGDNGRIQLKVVITNAD